MVFGFGEGKVEIVISKNNFVAGETISGTVKISLKKAKKAKQVRIRLVCEEEYWNTFRNSQGRLETRNEKRTLYSFEQVLDTEKEYPPTDVEYPFSIQVPSQTVSTAHPITQVIVGALTTGSMIGNNSRIKWYLDAALDVPMSADISKRVQIGVG